MRAEVKKIRQEMDREKENSRRMRAMLSEKDERENDITQMLEAKDSQVSVLKVRLSEAEEKLRVADSELLATRLENERSVLLRCYLMECLDYGCRDGQLSFSKHVVTLHTPFLF